MPHLDTRHRQTYGLWRIAYFVENMSEDDAIRATMVSLDSTMRSNETVGPPLEIISYDVNALVPGKYRIFRNNYSYLKRLRTGWEKAILDAFHTLPVLPKLSGLQKKSLSLIAEKPASELETVSVLGVGN